MRFSKRDIGSDGHHTVATGTFRVFSTAMAGLALLATSGCLTPSGSMHTAVRLNQKDGVIGRALAHVFATLYFNTGSIPTTQGEVEDALRSLGKHPILESLDDVSVHKGRAGLVIGSCAYIPSDLPISFLVVDEGGNCVLIPVIAKSKATDSFDTLVSTADLPYLYRPNPRGDILLNLDAKTFSHPVDRLTGEVLPGGPAISRPRVRPR